MKHTVLFSFFWICFLLNFSQSFAEKTYEVSNKEIQAALPFKHDGYEINIISKKNKAGLSRDIQILTRELTALGHSVEYVKSNVLQPIPKADINIFLENVDDFFFPYADKNYLIPNPEWYECSEDLIPRLDMILCKTREAEKIFKARNPNTTFMSFTCFNRLDKNVKKEFQLALHLAGKSLQKGTDTIIQSWSRNPHFPGLLLIRFQGSNEIPPLYNLKLIYTYLRETELIELQNMCGIHLCPSETEGFGQYLFEALSCGSVVVTTDAPPMNEFITDKRCLAGYHHTQPQCLATNYYVDQFKLDQVIDNLKSLPEKELQKIGKRNREFYLENDRFFKQRLAEIFPKKSIKSN